MPDARKPGFLMCAPSHYRVEYVINPWMEDGMRRGAFSGAWPQWTALRSVLERDVGAEVEVLPARAGLPDMVFTANAGLVAGSVFVPSRFRYAQRAGEVPHFTAWAREHGFLVCELPGTAHFEGAGDALFDRAQPILWMGHGFRTDPGAAAELDRILRSTGFRTTSLRLTDPRYYHLDTCFCPLEGGHTLYYPPAFAPESRKTIEEHIPVAKRIIVEEDDAVAFACNAVNVGDAVVLNSAGDRLRGQLEDRGFRVFSTGLREFMAAGGAAKCLTLRLDEPRPLHRSGSESPAPV